ncbi:MAG: hypothetical protein RLZZ314_1615, partial [Bacteroidota bacterium]
MSPCISLFASPRIDVMTVVLALLASPSASAQFCTEPLHTAVMTSGIWAEEVTWEVITLQGEVVAGPFGPYEDN